MRREKDEQYFALKQITELHREIEQKNKELQVEKNKLEIDLKELSNTLWKHFIASEINVQPPSKSK